MQWDDWNGNLGIYLCGNLIENPPQLTQAQPSQDETSSNPTFVTIPYVKNTSEAIRRILTPLGIKTTFQPINTLRHLIVHPKDPIPKEDKAGVVYQIPCSDCPQTYIGPTGRTLGQRLKEHKKAVKDKNTLTSALAEHTCQTGHTVDWSQTEIVGTSQNTYLKKMPFRIMDDPERTAHIKQRTWNITHHIPTTILVPQYLLLFLHHFTTRLIIIHTSSYHHLSPHA